MPTRPPVHNPLPPSVQAKVAQQREDEKERRRKQYEAGEQRTKDKKFYSSTRWTDFRKWFLKVHPLCVECKKEGRIVPANQVDHVKPRKERPDLAFDEDNCQPLCRVHHGKKTRQGK